MTPAGKAILGSFAVYLLPIVGPHFVLPWGAILWMEAVSQSDRREPLWLGADFGLALLVQGLAAIGLFVFFRARRRWRYLILAGSVPALFWIVEMTYLIVIPRHFLIEDDVAPEQTDWEVECTVPDAWLTPVRSGVKLALEQAREAWIARSDQRLGILSMPGCRVTDIGLTSSDTGGAMNQVAPHGVLLFGRWSPERAEQSTWFLPSGSTEPLRVEEPPMKGVGSPVLSTDGRALAWLAATRTPDGEGFRYQVHIRDLPEGGERTVGLPETGFRHPQLVAFESGSELVLSNRSQEIVAIDLEGNILWGPHHPAPIDRVTDNFRRQGEGWVAWDAYRERERYRVAWSLLLGEGHYEIPKGRSITSLAVDTWGRYIAVSVSPQYSLGKVRDSVLAIRAYDGREAYRRYLDPYARAQVAFLGAHFLAVSRFEDGKSWVEVLRAPGPHPVAEARGWVSRYRSLVLPLLGLLQKLDDEGLGQEDCGVIDSLVDGAPEIAERAPDEITGQTWGTVMARLDEARGFCAVWNAIAFATSVVEIEYLLESIEDTLVYEHGLAALPELESAAAGSSSTRTVTDPLGRVRARRFRSH